MTADFLAGIARQLKIAKRRYHTDYRYDDQGDLEIRQIHAAGTSGICDQLQEDRTDSNAQGCSELLKDAR